MGRPLFVYTSTTDEQTTWFTEDESLTWMGWLKEKQSFM